MLLDLRATRPPLQQLQLRRSLGRPRISLIIGRDDLLGVFVQQTAERADIEAVIARRVDRQVLFREAQQTHGGLQTPAMLRMRRLLEIFLEMNKTARRLDQAFEKIGIGRIDFEPKLLEDIVRLVVALFVPALEIGAVKGVLRRFGLRKIDIFTEELLDQLRNPLAFAHGAHNLIAAQTMGKRRPSRFADNGRSPERARNEQ